MTGHCCNSTVLLDYDKFILARAQTDLFGMREAGAPFRFRARISKMIVVVHKSFFGEVFGKLAARQGLGLHTCVHTGLIKGQRVKRGEHANVWQNRRVIFAMAVAVGRDIDNQRDVEVRATLHHGLGVFGHFTVEHFNGGVKAEGDSVEVARPKAAPTAYAVVVVYGGLFGFGREVQGVVGALFNARTAANALCFVDVGLAVAVLLRFTSPRARSPCRCF